MLMEIIWISLLMILLGMKSLFRIGKEPKRKLAEFLIVSVYIAYIVITITHFSILKIVIWVTLEIVMIKMNIDKNKNEKDLN